MTSKKMSNDSLLPSQTLPDGAHAFSDRLHGLMDGQPKDDATVARAMEGMDQMFDLIAAELYTLASMLVGEGEESVGVVEKAIATAEISVCHDAAEARKNSRRALCSVALDVLAQRDPGSLDAPEGLEPASTCIEDDDLDAAGVSREELERMIAGPDRDRVRKWLAGLPVAVRTIFVIRAVAGFSAQETAGLLAAHGGPRAAGWTTDAVREMFRQGLCSLASQLIQASVSSS
jgi:DNA-directed RNA polymerase specialized sigma24 family protein